VERLQEAQAGQTLAKKSSFGKGAVFAGKGAALTPHLTFGIVADSMPVLDWIVAIVPVLAVLSLAICAKGFAQGAADFLAGGCAVDGCRLGQACAPADVGLAGCGLVKAGQYGGGGEA